MELVRNSVRFLMVAVALLSLNSFALGMTWSEANNIEWQSDYGKAMEMAKAEKKMMLIHFVDASRPAKVEELDKAFAEIVKDGETAKKYVFTRLPVDAEIKSGGKPVKLLSHGAFTEMLGRPGLAVLDFVEPESKMYGHVVSVYPETESRQVRPGVVRTILGLPRGTLTQRSLVLAVRLHREQPKSAQAAWEPVLAEETEQHSQHQASINLQGHHNWDHRFHRIMGRLGNGMVAQEVCAESWPGQPLMDAAEECVHSWRQSSGHWGAVSAEQASFAYDMKKGSNGTWYATGIFAR